MKKKTLPAAAAAVLAAALMAGFASADTNDPGADVAADVAVIEETANNDLALGSLESIQTTDVAASDLSQADIDGLAFMVEEEKLAHDVYLAMYDTWGLPIFDNIAAAEETHISAVQTLLNQYQLPDPSEGLGAGEFSNPDLQALYDEFVATGNQSATDALMVGALIEEMDITDLQLRESSQPNIDLVYSNLERGSRNHLRAFNRQLEARGVTYTPLHLDQVTFDQITNNPTESGSQGSVNQDGQCDGSQNGQCDGSQDGQGQGGQNGQNGQGRGGQNGQNGQGRGGQGGRA